MLVGIEAEIDNVGTMHDSQVSPSVIIRLVERSIDEVGIDKIHWLPFRHGAVYFLSKPNPEGCCAEGSGSERPLPNEPVHPWQVAPPESFLVPVDTVVIVLIAQPGCIRQQMVTTLRECQWWSRHSSTVDVPFISSIT